MREQLLIGELARLAGVTVKTVRHYHKRGLLAEPERSEGGYRLYGAGDLLRLQRIRRLQSLGLTLEQVRDVLGAPEQARPLWAILGALREAVRAQIGALEARLALIEQLLADESLERLEQPSSPTFEQLKAQLGPLLASVDPALLAQEQALWSLFDGFQWPEGYREGMQQVLAALAEHASTQPERFHQLLAEGAAFAALLDLPEESTEVERLAEALAASDVMAWVQRLAPAPDPLDAPHARVLDELAQAQLAPAQRRLMALLAARLGKRGDGVMA